ncbi:hypothetical protein [Pseudomonas sp. TH31]|nr:hypothetical protein [Pseudomonas sp. TH31]MBK5413410.1 hypothetical protein [Pseudomonas sp. TH31]
MPTPARRSAAVQVTHLIGGKEPVGQVRFDHPLERVVAVFGTAQPHLCWR